MTASSAGRLGGTVDGTRGRANRREQLATSLPPGVLPALHQAARRFGLSTAEMTRAAVAEYLFNHREDLGPIEPEVALALRLLNDPDFSLRGPRNRNAAGA